MGKINSSESTAKNTKSLLLKNEIGKKQTIEKHKMIRADKGADK